MEDNGLVRLDTSAFDKALGLRDEILRSYDKINTEYARIEKALLANWKGRGADAFKKDSRAVRTNLVGLNDILKTMCDTLADCKDIFAQCDSELGKYNSDPKEK